ncbi:MAG TPA: response regulator, partial [Chthoniobacteraceae bacterium]|nr:response regulator [Chthoniobacteraceae bacterium]
MKILLVDDDPAVLQVLLAILKRNPAYTTTIGTNGPLAIENAESAGGVDLLITDVVMEPTDGFTLRGQLQEIYPEMKTIFISGFDLSDYAAHTYSCDVFSKPVDGEALLAAAAKVEAALPPRKPKATVRTLPAPVAQPQAQPTAGPVAQPTATPVQAQPTAVPVAQPTATPVQAQPTAVPVAQPTATPVQAQPTAVPVAQP